MRSVEGDVGRIWGDIKFLSGCASGLWMLRNSAALIPLIDRFNIFHSLSTLDTAPPLLASYDFERLFTKLDQEDLKLKLGWLLDTVWALHNRPLLKVRKDASPRWQQGAIPARRAGKDRDDGFQFYFFDLQSAKDLVNFLIGNAFVQVRDTVYRQIRGVPMGISPAMYFANYYLFCYEYSFFQDAIQAHNTAPARSPHRARIKRLLRIFRFVGRYADDISFLLRTTAQEAQQLFKASDTVDGIHGIYPDCLTLHSTTISQGSILRALDVEVSPTLRHPVTGVRSGPLLTRLHDKRRTPLFQDLVSVLRFPAADSMLSWSCKYNVFNSQFVRFSRLITDPTNFRAEVVRLLVEMISNGYSRTELIRRCNKLCKVTPVRFGMARGTESMPDDQLRFNVNFGRPPRGLFPAMCEDVHTELVRLGRLS